MQLQLSAKEEKLQFVLDILNEVLTQIIIQLSAKRV